MIGGSILAGVGWYTDTLSMMIIALNVLIVGLISYLIDLWRGPTEPSNEPTPGRWDVWYTEEQDDDR